MSTRLEQFIKDHREDFDDERPSPKVWDNIENEVIPEKKISATVVKINFMRWSAAAAAVILVALAAWMMLRTKTTKQEMNQATGIAKTQPVRQKQNEQPSTDSNKTTVPDNNAAQQQLASNDKSTATTRQQNDDAATQQSNVNEELYHFAKIVEIKHRELKAMAKDEPLLYKQFSGDVNKLDSVYHSLETKFSKNQNSEELLEAMIQNLQLQMQLLNHQLEIVKQLNHSKKSAYEKAYQSI